MKRGELVSGWGLSFPDQAKLIRAGKDGVPVTDGMFPESTAFSRLRLGRRRCAGGNACGAHAMAARRPSRQSPRVVDSSRVPPDGRSGAQRNCPPHSILSPHTRQRNSSAETAYRVCFGESRQKRLIARHRYHRPAECQPAKKVFTSRRLGRSGPRAWPRAYP
jgi:hypothetical protein